MMKEKTELLLISEKLLASADYLLEAHEDLLKYLDKRFDIKVAKCKGKD
jgi:hypothetical protein